MNGKLILLALLGLVSCLVLLVAANDLEQAYRRLTHPIRDATKHVKHTVKNKVIKRAFRLKRAVDTEFEEAESLLE